MSKKKIYFLFFVLGIGIGIFFTLNKAKASNPQGEPSGGEVTASVYYDESWKATETVVSTENGYQYFYPYGNPPEYPLPAQPLTQQTPIAGKLENTAAGWIVRLFPKMVVTKWKVHGHIHYE